MGCIHLNYDTTFAVWYVDRLIALNAIPVITKMTSLEDLLVFLLGTVDNIPNKLGTNEITLCYFKQHGNIRCTCFTFQNKIQYSGTIEDEHLYCVDKTKCISKNNHNNVKDEHFIWCTRCNKSVCYNILDRFTSLVVCDIANRSEYSKQYNSSQKFECCTYHKTVCKPVCD